MNAGLSTKNAPSPIVVLPHYAIGSIAFIIASVLLFFISGDIIKTNLNPQVLSVTHIFILGWITLIIFGALYQLIPVVMEVKLYSEILAHISLVTMVTGAAMLSYSFWNTYIVGTLLLQVGGSAILISVILFIVNVVMSAIKSKQKTIENTFILTAAIWLLFTVSIGIFITINFAKHYIDKSNFDLLKIHAQIGLIGWFMMLVIGVASTLMPMFFIAHKLNKTYLKLSYFLTNGGLILLMLSLYFFDNTYILFFTGLIILSGISFFIKYNYDAYKKRLRKKLDIGMKLSVLAFTLLFSTLVFGILSLTNFDFLSDFYTKIRIAYGVSLILGFFTSLILGQMYKTLPFIVWLQKYQDKVGKFKIPMPANLYSEKVANAHYYTFISAFVLLIVAIFTELQIIAQISAVLFIITSLLYSYNTFMIIFHKENLKPLK